MTYLVTRNFVLAAGLSLCLIGCADDPEELPPTEDAVNTVTELGKSRDILVGLADTHRENVMLRGELRDIAIDELTFHNDSFTCLNDMQFHLETLAACLNTDHDSMERSDALIALQELRVEIRAHQVGMLTMLDPDTAQAAERVFHSRQNPLLEELEAHVTAFLSVSANYECTF